MDDTVATNQDPGAPVMSQAKKRFRRQLRPPEKGNNQFGRVGKLKCAHCRKMRSKVFSAHRYQELMKCEYAEVEDICKLCRKKNLSCGEKLFGPKRAEDLRVNVTTTPSFDSM